MQPEHPDPMKSAAAETTTPELTLTTGVVGEIIPTRAGHGAALLVDTPVLAVLDSLRADIATLNRLDPSSGSLSTLRDYETRLRVAVDEGRRADAWVSTEEAARHRGVTPSAITKMCRQGKLKSRKTGGIWQVHKDAITAEAA